MVNESKSNYDPTDNAYLSACLSPKNKENGILHRAKKHEYTTSKLEPTNEIHILLETSLRDKIKTINNLPGKPKNWERECDRDPLRYSTGEYRMDLFSSDFNATLSPLEYDSPGTIKRTTRTVPKLVEENNEIRSSSIVVHEGSSCMGMRVWDSSVLMSKWFEKAQIESYRSQSFYPSCSSLPSSAPFLRRKKVTDGNAIHGGKGDGLRVLELGAGTGLLSIALAKLGAAVLATEYGPLVPHLCKNCERNNVFLHSGESNEMNLVNGKVMCEELDWYSLQKYEGGNFVAKRLMPFDIIVASDCSLTPSDSKAIVEVMKCFTTPCITVIHVGMCLEREGTSTFIDAAKRKFSHLSFIDPKEFHANYKSKRQIIVKLMDS